MYYLKNLAAPTGNFEDFSVLRGTSDPSVGNVRPWAVKLSVAAFQSWTTIRSHHRSKEAHGMVILLRSRFQWPRAPAAIGVATAGFGVFCLHRGEYLRFFAQKDSSGGARYPRCVSLLSQWRCLSCWKDHSARHERRCGCGGCSSSRLFTAFHAPHLNVEVIGMWLVMFPIGAMGLDST